MGRRKMSVGDVFKSKNFGEVIVLDINGQNATFKFLDTGSTLTRRKSQVYEGDMKDPLGKTCYGKGCIGVKQFNLSGSVRGIGYSMWQGMLQRCFDEKFKNRHTSYRDTTIDDRFLDFSYFMDWAEQQKGFMCKDEKGRYFQLDKDLLVSGNNNYSPETCCFVPREVNNIVIRPRDSSKTLPVGVYAIRKKFNVKLSRWGKLEDLGYFNTIEDAFKVYKQAKESYIKEVANNWKGCLDQRIYERLINYEEHFSG